MFSDRYEIHIQAFVDFIKPIFMFFFDPHLRLFKISKFHSFTISKFQDFEISKAQKVGCTHVPKFWIFLFLIFPKIMFFQDVPIYFLIFLKYFGIIKAINTGSTGPELVINRSKI